MAVSNTADLFFSLWNTFLFLAIIVGAFVFALMAFLLFKYRARASLAEPTDTPVLGKLPAHRGHARTIVASVTLSALILSVLIFGTFSVIDQISTIPAVCGTVINYATASGPCLGVRVLGCQWVWRFYYNSSSVPTSCAPAAGGGSMNLVVPRGRIVVLNVTSGDVVHNLTLVEFKIKTDAIPGRFNVIWFNATQVGTYKIQCYELCGTGHAGMFTNLVVVPSAAAFNTWLSSTESTTAGSQ